MARRVQGQTAYVPLTRLGHQQALAAADRLADSGAVLVLSSDLRRALDTARPIADRLGVPLQSHGALREQSLGDFEGLPSDVVFAAVGAEVTLDPTWRPPGGESLADVHDRVRPFLRQAFQTAPEGPLVIVTHGDTARVLVAVLRGLALAAAPVSVPANGEVLTLLAQPPCSHAA